VTARISERVRQFATSFAGEVCISFVIRPPQREKGGKGRLLEENVSQERGMWAWAMKIQPEKLPAARI